MCRGQGGIAWRWSLVHNVSEYAERLQRCIRDTSERQKRAEVDNAGSYSDITPLLRGVSLSVWGGGGGVTEMEVLDSIRDIGQMDSWEPLVIGVQPSLELH